MPGPKKETIHIKVDPGLRESLDAFSEANLGAPHSEIFRRAVVSYMEEHLANDPQMKSRYQEALAQARRDSIHVLRTPDGHKDGRKETS